MDEENKNKIVRLVQKEKTTTKKSSGPSKEDLLNKAKDYDSLIIIGWKGEFFTASWINNLTPEEVYMHLDIAKERVLRSLYPFEGA